MQPIYTIPFTQQSCRTKPSEGTRHTCIPDVTYFTGSSFIHSHQTQIRLLYRYGCSRSLAADSAARHGKCRHHDTSKRRWLMTNWHCVMWQMAGMPIKGYNPCQVLQKSGTALNYCSVENVNVSKHERPRTLRHHDYTFYWTQNLLTRTITYSRCTRG